MIAGVVHGFTINGKYDKDSVSGLDLYMAPVKKKFYVNLYTTGIGNQVHTSIESARDKILHNHIRTLEFEYEE